MSFLAAAASSLYDNYVALQYKCKAIQKELESFKNKGRYKKQQEDYHRIIAGYTKEIKKLNQELAAAHAETKKVGNIGYNECCSNWDDYLKGLEKKDKEIQKLSDKYWALVREFDEKIDSITKKYEEELAKKDAIIEKLKAELAHKEALLDRDSTNTNLPTSQTPLGKKKHIPNSRRSSGKKKGGQPGHKKHTLEKPAEDEITDYVEYELDEEICPTCGSEDFSYTGECEDKYEYDIEINVVKRVHRIWIAQCNNCGELVKTSKGPKLKAESQYGANVDALSLSLMNTTNATMNKVPTLLSGLTGGEIQPSEAYMAKKQKRAAELLKPFREDLRKLIFTKPLLYWDDTVVWANKKRICMRFYGDETLAFYAAHEKKDMKGILEDGILQALPATSKVMHDHNKVNYNALFCFVNLECNAHLQRDLQKRADETGHMVLIEIKDLISQTMKDRNDLLMEGKKGFEDAYIRDFDEKLSELLVRSEEQAMKNTSSFSGPCERALVARIKKYRENFFAWVKDFEIPTTNNLSERGLRCVKSKQKVSGQFASVETADYYAIIRTYIETCKRNKINEMDALIRLCNGNPYSVEEIFSLRKQLSIQSDA